MRGLVKGAASSSANPILQLFVRSGGLLVDPVAATYKIDDIHDPAAVTARVPQTGLTLATAKLGTGRYAIPTGDTVSWTLGTHRVTCTYQLTAGGVTYTQAFLFELLDPGDWASSYGWTSYLSTRQVRQDALVGTSVTTATLHRHLNRIAKQIEGWCRRFFEPRYLALRKSGRESPVLALDEAIIAIESIQALYQMTDGEDSITYDTYLYKVFNRHLDQGLDGDDRFNPQVQLISLEHTSLKRLSGGSYVWPAGHQNLLVKGVFGYTDPETDPLGGRTLLGQTPEDIAYVSGILLARAVTDPYLSDPATSRPGSILSYRTRHQAITFANTGGGGSGGGGSSLSGDSLVDDILAKYGPPLNVAGV